jgi:hypothetical protein
MKGLKITLCGIALILVGIGFSCSARLCSSGAVEVLLFISGLCLAFYGAFKKV